METYFLQYILTLLLFKEGQVVRYNVNGNDSLTRTIKQNK